MSVGIARCSHSSASANRGLAGKAHAASFPTGTWTSGSSIRTANPSARSFAPGFARFSRSRTSSKVCGPSARIARASRVSRSGSTRAPRALRIARIPASSTGCSVGRSATKSRALETWSVPRSNVARTALRPTRSCVRSSRRNPSTRPHRPTNGGRGTCACRPTSLSIAASGLIRLASEQHLSRERRAVELPQRQRLRCCRLPPSSPIGAYFFGKPTDWAKTMSWLSRSFSALESAGRSTDARTPVASPSEAQNR